MPSPGQRRVEKIAIRTAALRGAVLQRVDARAEMSHPGRMAQVTDSVSAEARRAAGSSEAGRK